MSKFRKGSGSGPKEIITVVSDILAGIAIAGCLTDAWYIENSATLFLLVVSALTLYCGRVCLQHDTFDTTSFIISFRKSKVFPMSIPFGYLLLGIGVIYAWLVSDYTGWIATGLSMLYISTAVGGTRTSFFSPLLAGLHRGAYLSFGMSVTPLCIKDNWWIVLISFLYISASEFAQFNHGRGRSRRVVIRGMMVDAIVLVLFLTLGMLDYINLMASFPFLMLWCLINLTSKMKAYVLNKQEDVEKAMFLGGISLMALNAIYVAVFSGMDKGLLVVLLIPFTIFLTKKKSVTYK